MKPKSSLSRKPCPHCGEQSFADEWRCWACGRSFSGPSDDATLVPAPAERPRSASPAIAAILCLFLGIGIGFTLARPKPEPPSTARATPPLIPGPSGGPGVGRSAPLPVPVVAAPSASQSRPPRTTRNPFAGPPPVIRERPVPRTPASKRAPAAMVVVRPPLAQRVAARPVPTPPSALPSPPTPARSRRPEPSGERAVVEVLNSVAAPLEVQMTGPVSQTARVAPRSRIRFPMPPGRYHVELRSPDRVENRGSITLLAGDNYTLRFEAPDAPSSRQ